MAEHLFSIIIPTYNNPQYLDPCVKSILDTGILKETAELIIVNNGKQPIKQQYANIDAIKVIDCEENLGWEGGLKEGLKQSNTKFVCFQNDDTFIPHANLEFYYHLLSPFQDKQVASVGPATTVAAGLQSIYHPYHPFNLLEVNWLIYFTVMVRREYVDAVGGIDNTLPGGDDFDLSIRLNDGGYRNIINPQAFIIHHAFKTGNRVHGDHNVDGGWNSGLMQERTNKALIQKHGFAKFFYTFANQMKPQPILVNALDREYEGSNA